MSKKLDDSYRGINSDGVEALRAGIFRCSYSFLDLILRGRFNKAATFVSDVPIDFAILSVSHCHEKPPASSKPEDTFDILAASSEWDPVVDGEIPIKTVMFEAIHPEKEKPDEKVEGHQV